MFQDGKFNANAVPNWQKIKQSIKTKYGSYYADKLVLDGMARYNAGKQNYQEYFKYRGILLDKYSSDMNNDMLNTYCWEICQLSTDNKVVASAAKAMIRVVKTEKDSANLLPAAVDTYANLLYRLGKKQEAIRQEELAVYYAVNYEKGRMVEENKATLEKMKKR